MRGELCGKPSPSNVVGYFVETGRCIDVPGQKHLSIVLNKNNHQRFYAFYQSDILC